MQPAATLLEILQSLIERTYRMETGVRDLSAFVVGDRGFERAYRGASIVERVAPVGSKTFSDAKVLVRQDQHGVFVSLYLPDRLIADLEAKNPLGGVDERNLDSFAVFVEEVDHFLTVADRARSGRSFSLFELELHAGVTKYLVGLHFLARSLGRSLRGDERAWLRWTLFEKLSPPLGPPDVRARYIDADRLAARYSLRLDRMAGAERLDELRRFHRMTAGQAVRRIDEAVAA